VTGVAAEPYRRDKLAVVVRKDFPIRKKKAFFAEFSNQDFVVFEAGRAIQQIPFAVASEAGSALRLRIKAGSYDAICRLIEAGLGIGVLPMYAAMQFERFLELRHIELNDEWAERQLLICTNLHQVLGVAAKQLVDLLVHAEVA
jgi:DNA-binding transcriptional LysR family regulator